MPIRNEYGLFGDEKVGNKEKDPSFMNAFHPRLCAKYFTYPIYSAFKNTICKYVIDRNFRVNQHSSAQTKTC